MSLYIPDEIINHISEYLPIIDRYRMKNMCKEYYSAIRIRLEDFENVLIKRINQSSNSNIGYKLLQMIKKSDDNIQIGGSTISQCLYNEFREESDIDIYVTYDESGIDSDSIHAAYMTQKYVSQMTELLKNETKLVPDTDIEFNGATENYMIEGYHINYYEKCVDEKNPIKIQLILIPILYNKDEIYDFTFCCNRYDGKNVYSNHKNDVITKSGYMNEWNNIYSKAKYTRGCSQTRVCEHMLLRANKYMERGYKILNFEERLDQINNQEEVKKNILRDYYDSDSKITKIRNTPLNKWLEASFDTMSGVTMGTRTIEIAFTDSCNNAKVIINNKGNPIIDDESKYIDVNYWTDICDKNDDNLKCNEDDDDDYDDDDDNDDYNYDDTEYDDSNAFEITTEPIKLHNTKQISLGDIEKYLNDLKK